MDGIDKKIETGRIKKGIRLDTRVMEQEIEVEVQQLDYGFEVRILAGMIREERMDV